MRNLNDIHAEIDRLSERRTELWHALSAGLDPLARDEIKELDARLAAL